MSVYACARLHTAAVMMVLVLIGGTASAAPITFTFTTTGEGTWERADGTSIDFGLSTLIEVVLRADTAELQDPWVTPVFGTTNPAITGYGQGTTVTASLSVAGVPLGDFANPAYVFRNGNSVGFGDYSNFDMFGSFDGTFANYDLDETFGPVTGAAYLPGYMTIALASGESVDIAELSPFYGVTFSALVEPDVSSVPEPATFGLLAMGLGGILTRRRRQASR